MNLRIVSGQELGQFADLNGNPLGHDVTVQGFNVDQVTFLANGTEPDSISDFVTIEASSFGITRTTTIEVLRISESPIWLVMDAQGDVSYGAEMSILAQALNMFQQEVSAGTGVTYSFQIIEGSEWGTLFRGALEGNIISGVRPTDDFFSRGMATIGFRARKTEPAIPQRVTVRVSASNPDIHPGTYSFNVLPSPLAITVTPSTISNGQTATISVQKKNPDGTVSPWLQDAGFSYEIIKGHNAGYVLHPDTARRDDFFNSQSDTIQFVALEESPQPDTVEVQFYIYVFNEGGGIATAAFDPIKPNPTLRRTGLASVTVVKGDSLDHFAVGLEKDTIAFTETSKIFVVAKDRDSNDVALAGDALLQFSIDSTAYGSFIRANGDTVPSPLSNVLYSDARAGNIRFAAVNKNPDSLVSFRVITRLQADTTKSGDTTLVLLEQTLKIVMNEPYDVRPVIPPTTVNNPHADNRKDFSIKMTRGGRPVVGHPFRLTTDYVDSSGGHHHVDPRRENNRENYGHFILRRTNTHHSQPYQGQTQSEGVEEFDYVASVWGDTIKISLESKNNYLLKDSVKVVEKIPELENLADIWSNFWRLTGNVGTTSYGRCPGTVIRHPDSHYGTEYTLEQLQLGILDFFAWSGTSLEEGGFGTYLVLGINDMSLKLGGLFDICSTWRPGHTYHRTGTSVDIGNATEFENNGNLFNLHTTLVGNRTLLEFLTDFMTARGGAQYPEEPIHYGFGGR